MLMRFVWILLRIVAVFVAALMDERLGRRVEEVADDGGGTCNERCVLCSNQLDRFRQQVD